jgi:tripartite ATP-independent transporter DctM subunit
MGAFFMAGMYVAAALGALSLIMMHFFSDAPLWNIMANKSWEGNTSFILVAVPLFILMGELMNRSGMGERMYAGITRWIWWLPGGLIHTNIVSCAIFAACSGSSVATSATISRVSLPSFRARGYSERMVIGSLAAGGTLGILIPPSISLIIYGVLVEESIGRLYMAGFVPGMVLTLTFIVMILVLALVWRGLAPRESGDSFITIEGWVNRLVGTISLVPIVALIIVVIGSIYGGIATPSEAAAFGVYGAFVLAGILNTEEILLPMFGGLMRAAGLTNASNLLKWILGLLVAALLLHLILQIACALAGADLSDEVVQLFGVNWGPIVGENIFLVEVVIVPWTGWVPFLVSASPEQLRDARFPDTALQRQIFRRNFMIVQDAFLSTVRTTGMIFLIVLAAFTLSFAFARLGISQQIAEAISGLGLNDWQLVLVLVVFYLVLGTFMESFAMMVTTVPILVPTLEGAGVDLVWFGVIMVLLVEAALISPPEGINLYVLHGVRLDVDREQAEAANEVLQQSTIADVWIGVLPFMGCMAITTALVLFIPALALALPDAIYGARQG